MVIIAVGLGVWAGVLMTALSYSINEARKVKTIETQIGHVQVHHPDFVSEDDFNNYMSYSKGMSMSGIVPMNGSSDYIEIYANLNVTTGSPQISGSVLGFFIGV